MSFLVRKFFFFLGLIVVLFGSVFISYRCGYGAGLKDAPRHFYTVDVSRALRDNSEFRSYVADVYKSAYVGVMDSLLRKDKLLAVVGQWLDEHPDCQIKKEVRLPLDVKSAERVIFKGVKF